MNGAFFAGINYHKLRFEFKNMIVDSRYMRTIIADSFYSHTSNISLIYSTIAQ